MSDGTAPQSVQSVELVDTPVGTGRLTVWMPPGRPLGTLALGHGAGGGIAARDLVAAAETALARRWRVVLVEQPWRVAGRRVASAPPRLDRAWLALVAAPAAGTGPGRGPLVVGGRSAGARVACRTASQLGASGVIALAFPLHPPGTGGEGGRSRADELALPRVPLLVVQGRRDPFGSATEVRTALAGPEQRVVELDGDHALAADLPGLQAAVGSFLDGLGGGMPP